MIYGKIWLATYKGEYTNPQDVVLIENLTIQQYRRLRGMFGPFHDIDHVWDYMPEENHPVHRVRLNYWRGLASE